jgi:hypothetical protein
VRLAREMTDCRESGRGLGMATARHLSELKRWADLTVVHRVIEAPMPDLPKGSVGLKNVAELCRRDYVARPGRDCNEVRDQLLLIGIEWDLTSDRLDQQSDACLTSIADFLR